MLAAALMLSTAAHAASSAADPCDQVGRDLKSLELPVDALTVNVVDHIPTDPAAINQQSAEFDADAVVPILDLTPRVTNILRDVFRTTTEALPQELPGETPEQSSSSPVADSDENSDTVDPEDAANETNTLPRFQQQMFRTDI